MDFATRQDGGRRLASYLMDLKVGADVVLGLPRGGVVVAAEEPPDRCPREAVRLVLQVMDLLEVHAGGLEPVDGPLGCGEGHAKSLGQPADAPIRVLGEEVQRLFRLARVDVDHHPSR